MAKKAPRPPVSRDRAIAVAIRLADKGGIDSLTMRKPVPPLTIPRRKEGFTTQIFWDSDVGKWIEAASYALSHRRDAVIEAQIDEITVQLEKTQAPSGYLNCWYLQREPENRWTNLRDNHELYNAGHLLEGAIAYFQATGRRALLDIIEKYVGIRKVFRVMDQHLGLGHVHTRLRNSLIRYIDAVGVQPLI